MSEGDYFILANGDKVHWNELVSAYRRVNALEAAAPSAEVVEDIKIIAAEWQAGWSHGQLLSPYVRDRLARLLAWLAQHQEAKPAAGSEVGHEQQ